MRRPMHRQSRHVARAALSAMGATLVAGAGALPLAHATVAAPTTTLVTEDSGGGPANGGSWDPYLSGDGRYVVYWSLATDLVAGDTNGTWDVYLRDTVANTSTRVSRDRFGGDPNGPSEWVNISQDGRYVAYLSFASDIVAGDTNGRVDVFRWDQLTGQTVRVSVSRTGGNANGNSTDPFMSGDGRYVTFWSLASNLVTGDGNNMYDVFSRDMLTGTTTRISVDTNG